MYTYFFFFFFDLNEIKDNDEIVIFLKPIFLQKFILLMRKKQIERQFLTNLLL